MKNRLIKRCSQAVFVLLFSAGATASAQTHMLQENIFEVENLKPTDSVLKVREGDIAPDFSLPSVHHGLVSLSGFRGKKNVLLSFVPAAWTPVCSGQWPGYNMARFIFDEHETIVLGITVDNIPTLYAWTNQMTTDGSRVWFPVLSDFYPHGLTAENYGVLRGAGTSERAIFIIDKEGIIRHIDVHDINKRPPLEEIVEALEKLPR